MQDFVIYVLLSAIESISLFYLAFKIFKIDQYVKEMIFAGLIMGFFSYFTRDIYGMANVDVFLQYILIFCFFWILFRIHIFYAVIMTGMAYQAYMLVQSLLYLIISATGTYELHFPTITVGISLLQLSSAAAVVSIGYIIGKKRKGFDFVPDKPDGKIQVGSREKILFALTIPSILVVMLMLYLVQHLYQYFFLVPLLYALLLFGYLYHSNKKDRGVE